MLPLGLFLGDDQFFLAGSTVRLLVGSPGRQEMGISVANSAITTLFAAAMLFACGFYFFFQCPVWEKCAEFLEQWKISVNNDKTDFSSRVNTKMAK